MKTYTRLGDDFFEGESAELRARHYFHNSQMKDDEPVITHEMILGREPSPKHVPDPALEQANTKDLKRKGLK